MIYSYLAVCMLRAVPQHIIILFSLLFSNNLRFIIFFHFFHSCFLFCVFYDTVLFCVWFLLLCCRFPILVQVYRPLSPGGNPTAVNKYTIYHIIYNKIISLRVQNFYTEFNPNRSINMENKGRNSFTPLSMTVTPPTFTKLTRVRSLFVNKFYTEFHENSTKSLFADNR